MCYLSGFDLHRNLFRAIQDLKLSADLGSPDMSGWMAENGIGIPVDFAFTVRNYELSSDCSATGSICCGWCLDAGKGIPIDVMVAAEFFKKASDSNDTAVAKPSAVVLSGAKALMKTSNAWFCIVEKPRLNSSAQGYMNFARCLEYGKGIDHDFISAAKFYPLSAELNDADA
jgi:TPR repeat protein